MLKGKQRGAVVWGEWIERKDNRERRNNEVTRVLLK
jgi:hypothetical protein